MEPLLIFLGDNYGIFSFGSKNMILPTLAAWSQETGVIQITMKNYVIANSNKMIYHLQKYSDV